VRKLIAAIMALLALNSGTAALALGQISPKSEAKVMHSQTHTLSPHPPMVEQYLINGKLADGEASLVRRLVMNPRDDQARFGLGMLQFLRAVEKLCQDLSRYGVRDFGETRGFSRFLHILRPASELPSEKINYEKARQIVVDFEGGITKAEATLGGITDENVKLPLHFGLIRLDIHGDGNLTEEHSLWKLYMALQNTPLDITAEKARDFYVKFDRGDVHWLRGYCNVFLAICDMLLAYDSRETFERAGQLFFANVDSPYQAILSRRHSGKNIHMLHAEEGDIADIIAAIHSVRWKLIEPKRMQSALHHMETVVSESRISWKFILAETDNDHEWLPNPRQTSVIPDVRVTDEMVTAWAKVMNELDSVLSGKLLVPYFCAGKNEGINLRRVFLEPRDFDLVYWLQASDALPYIEDGPRTERATWDTLTRAFGQNFPGFALWFN